MSKLAKSSTVKIREICHQYPNEFGANSSGDLRCNFCDVLVKCGKNILWRVAEKVSFTELNW